MMRKMQISYPSYYDFDTDYPSDHPDRDDALKNLYYLCEHGLVKPNSIHVSQSIGGGFGIQFGASTLTHKGMDFLADDGGLSAILGVVTVKFEADQLKLLLESKVMATDLPPADKHRLIDGLRSLSAESIKHLTTKIVDLGWDNLGTLTRIIQSSLP